MAAEIVSLVFTLAAAAAISSGDAKIVEHTFHVGNLTLRRLCEDTVITAVNGQLPGPTIDATEGDTVVVHVINRSPYGITIHWHGVTQLLNCWDDGVSMITQCPIQPGSSYTYRFNVTGQEGTLWWHAHVSYLRATVHGALIIPPKHGVEAYPFPRPDKEISIVLGEWWKANVVNVEKEALDGNFDTVSDAFTINGRPGDLYMCSKRPEDTYKLEVEANKTYLLRLTNAALYNQFFYKVAGHSFTVVAVDASYTEQYKTQVIVIAPGQTVDALMVADAPPGHYYMAALAYEMETPNKDKSTTRGIIQYTSTFPSSSQVVMPDMPSIHDTPTAHHFYSNLTSLLRLGQQTVPLNVDEQMFITIGIGTICRRRQPWCKLNERITVATMNNISFQFPLKMSLLEAHYKGVKGVYTTDFPPEPPLFFDFTNTTILSDGPIEQAIELTVKGTKVKNIRYDASVEIVLQSTAILGKQSHPIHLHGHSFFVLAQGFGNYDAEKAAKSFNLINPQIRNTISVPRNGWAVIRFIANNPGLWFMHCHLELHLPIGMATAFQVENGPTPDKSIPPPRPDYPKCLSSRLETGWNGNIEFRDEEE